MNNKQNVKHKITIQMHRHKIQVYNIPLPYIT